MMDTASSLGRSGLRQLETFNIEHKPLTAARLHQTPGCGGATAQRIAGSSIDHTIKCNRSMIEVWCMQARATRFMGT